MTTAPGIPLYTPVAGSGLACLGIMLAWLSVALLGRIKPLLGFLSVVNGIIPRCKESCLHTKSAHGFMQKQGKSDCINIHFQSFYALKMQI